MLHSIGNVENMNGNERLEFTGRAARSSMAMVRTKESRCAREQLERVCLLSFCTPPHPLDSLHPQRTQYGPPEANQVVLWHVDWTHLVGEGECVGPYGWIGVSVLSEQRNAQRAHSFTGVLCSRQRRLTKLSGVSYTSLYALCTSTETCRREQGGRVCY